MSHFPHNLVLSSVCGSQFSISDLSITKQLQQTKNSEKSTFLFDNKRVEMQKKNQKTFSHTKLGVM